MYRYISFFIQNYYFLFTDNVTFAFSKITKNYTKYLNTKTANTIRLISYNKLKKKN